MVTVRKHEAIESDSVAELPIGTMLEVLEVAICFVLEVPIGTIW